MTYLGNISLWIALFFCVLQFINSRNKKNNYLIKKNFLGPYGILIFSSISFCLLTYGHIISDFSLVNVFQNSHITKPLIYKISGVWGNHEGSMLLWILVLSIFNYFIYRLYNKKNYIFIDKTLETQAIITFGFILFTVLTSNPFDKMLTIETNGMGFNPILQDPALAIHPPLLYIGYVGFSAAFSLSIGALNLEKNSKTEWYIYMKPFVLAAWTFLTLGISFGAFWAYYELGWGGWWFWDPVENASFMPWLLGTALLHSLITLHKKKSLQNWVLLLSILTFLLSVVGTFLVRSGILTSVHTFALDPTRGIYILALTAILGSYALITFYLKSKDNLNQEYFSFFSKEGSILANNVLMVIVCLVVLLGTIYPLIVEALSNNKISVGAPYFNATVIPIIIPTILIMGIGPLMSWEKEEKNNILKKIYPTIIVVALLIAITFSYYLSYSLIGMIGLIIGFWIIFNNLIPIILKKKLKVNGRIVAHIGVGLLILGVTGSSVWQKEKIIRMGINDEVQINKYNITFNKIEEIKEANYLALEGTFSVYDQNKKLITILKPQNRFYPITQNFTTEASIHSNIYRDLYMVLGQGNENDGWIIRVYHNPLVMWIWIGSFVMFVGGIISMMLNFRVIKRFI